MKRRLAVTITKVRRQTATVSSTLLRVRCPVCQREVDTLSDPETLSKAQSAELSAHAGRTLNDLIDSSAAHAVQTMGDGLRVCKDSLLAEQGEADTKASPTLARLKKFDNPR